MRAFKVFSHTADIGLSVRGKDLAKLFEHSASGLASLVSETKKIRPNKMFSFRLKAKTRESLLAEWLQEILYNISAKRVLFSKFKVQKISPFFIHAKAYGEPVDLKRHKIFREVKAVTYHGLKIRRTKTGYSTRIIFDI